MLYQFYESQRALLSPFAEFASATSKLYRHPLSPFSMVPGAQRFSAGLDLMHRLSKEYEKPEFGISSVKVGPVDVAVQEQVALEKPFCRLLRFKRFTDDLDVLTRLKDQPVVLIVAPLSGHHATLLRETVREMLRDHKVYVTDWTDARMVPIAAGPFHLDDYVEYVQDFLRHIGPAVHVMSVCQPTVPVLAAVSLMASRGETTPRTMTMMGGPIDARRSPTAVNNLATTKPHAWFENNVIHRVPTNFPGAGRRVYPGFLQHTGFVAMNPDRHMKSHYDYFRDLVRGDDGSVEFHRHFYDEYNAVLDMPAEYYLDTIKTVFQDFALVNGTWQVHGEPVRPQDIRDTALLTVEGELDDISGAGQTRAAHDLCTGVDQERQFHYDVEGAGHYGIFSGRRWREKVYPTVRDFIRRFEPMANDHPARPASAPPIEALALADRPTDEQPDAAVSSEPPVEGPADDATVAGARVDDVPATDAEVDPHGTVAESETAAAPHVADDPAVQSTGDFAPAEAPQAAGADDPLPAGEPPIAGAADEGEASSLAIARADQTPAERRAVPLPGKRKNPGGRSAGKPAKNGARL